jgi:uncharacterized protein YuzB (UPF0349 family)
MSKKRNDIRICHKCRHMSLKSMRTRLKKIDPEAKIKLGCQSYCGPCSRGVFIRINGRFVMGATEEEAIEKMKKYLR